MFLPKGSDVFWNYNRKTSKRRESYRGECACGLPPLNFSDCTGRLERTSKRRSSASVIDNDSPTPSPPPGPPPAPDLSDPLHIELQVPPSTTETTGMITVILRVMTSDDKCDDESDDKCDDKCDRTL